MIDLVIRGGTVVTSRGRFSADIHVHAGRIVALGALDAPPAQVVDAGGLFAMPGVVDSHVHFMDPGDPEREDFMTGSAAAAGGGTTTVVQATHGAALRDGGRRRQIDAQHHSSPL